MVTVTPTAIGLSAPSAHIKWRKATEKLSVLLALCEVIDEYMQYGIFIFSSLTAWTSFELTVELWAISDVTALIRRQWNDFNEIWIFLKIKLYQENTVENVVGKMTVICLGFNVLAENLLRSSKWHGSFVWFSTTIVLLRRGHLTNINLVCTTIFPFKAV